MRHMAKMSLAGLGMLGLSTAAHAQGCVLCYTSAAAAGPGAMHALDMGVLALLIPALVLFIAIFSLIAYRVRVASRPVHAVAVAPRLNLSTSFLRRVFRQRRSVSATA
jgi:hypothetical protein